MNEAGAAPQQLSLEEIERLALAAGITLTPQWRDDLVVGSSFALWAKERLRLLTEDQASPPADSEAWQRR